MKTEVIIGIIKTFLFKEKITAKEIADKYKISTRTVYRYLDEISLFFPIYTERGSGGGTDYLKDIKSA